MTIPLPVIANTFRCAFEWTVFGGQKSPANVMHFTGAAPAATPSDLVGALESSVSAGMWSLVSSDASVTSLAITPLDGTSPTSTFNTSGGAKWAGSATGGNIPQVAAVVSLKTLLRGRENRGRVYLPLLGEGKVQGGIILATDATSTQNAWNTFRTSMAAASPHAFSFVVASYDRKHSGASAHATPVASVFVSTFTATQRRRQPGRKVARH
jgi:hypothetical protein